MNEIESQDGGGAATTEVRSLLKESFHVSSFGDVLKHSAIVGAIIYLCLFLGYRKYYSILGIRPEDVGVNNTFVLARSIGFILYVALVTAVAVGLTSWFHLAFKDQKSTRRQALHIAAAGVMWAIVSVCFWVLDAPHRELAVLMGGLLTVACVAMAQYSHGSRRLIANSGLIMVALTIIAIPMLAAVISAYIRAGLVENGRESTPVTILGIPLLDVSAEKVKVSWICNDSQPPIYWQSQIQGGTIDAILVGETSTSYYIHLGDKSQGTSKIVKLPQSCAMLTYDAL